MDKRAQQGAALVVGLLLLMVLTLLAISGMSTSTLELQMAGNAQYSQKAFQAAEYGAERAFAAFRATRSEAPIAKTGLSAATGETDFYETTTSWNSNNGETDLPTGTYSMGVGVGYRALHYDIVSTGTSARNARAVVHQSFYIPAPAP